MSPAEVLKRTAIPRTSGLPSGHTGVPAAFDQRTSTGTSEPSRCAARHSAVASGVARKVPA